MLTWGQPFASRETRPGERTRDANSQSELAAEGHGHFGPKQGSLCKFFYNFSKYSKFNVNYQYFYEIVALSDLSDGPEHLVTRVITPISDFGNDSYFTMGKTQTEKMLR